jgi:hypothetical protein
MGIRDRGSFIPIFALGTFLRREAIARKSAGKNWDYLGEYKKISSRFHSPTLRANFSNEKFGFISDVLTTL